MSSTVVGRPREETELLARAKGGDAAAYEEIVVAYEKIAFRVAYLVAGDAADAEEAAQDGFVKAWYALGSFRLGEPFRPWLLRIVANEARNRRRSAGRRFELAARAAREVPGDAAPSPGTLLAESERRSALLAAVNALPEDQRLVVVCRYLLELSEAETAAVLSLAAGTVKSRLSRALASLRATLGESDD